MDIVINVLKDTKKHVMSGISYMIPVNCSRWFCNRLISNDRWCRGYREYWLLLITNR